MLNKVSHIILDIEGTTTSISFVHDVMFPYSAKRMGSFLQENASNPQVLQALEQVTSVAKAEGRLLCRTSDCGPELLRWIKEDRKHGALKLIQGMIWRQGFELGELKGHVYPEVPAAMKKWVSQGKTLGIYSSGSVEAQRMLFGYSVAGNLNLFLSFNFDTNTGPKREASSYARIALELGVPASKVLFLSDIVEECDAARSSGLHTGLVVRDPMGLQTVTLEHKHPIFQDFNQIN